MPDRYIDFEETQIYGPHATKQIRKLILKLVPKYDAALGHIADEIDDATAVIRELLKDTRGQDAERRAGVQKKRPILEEALDVLGRFSKHLDTHKAGVVDRKRFFPAGGGVVALGHSAPRILLALSHITKELERKDTPVREAKAWHKELAAVAAALAPAIAHADSAHAARRDLTPAVEQARTAWLQVYLAARSTVEAVLRLTGKMHLMPVVFHDLAVPAGTKVTEPPTPAPDPTLAPGAEPVPAAAPPPKTKPRARTRTRKR